MHNSIIDSGYTTERLSKENLPDLANLFAAVYGRKASEGIFEKKYDTVYTGKQYIGFIAYSKDHVAVGYYGVIPCFLKYSGETILAAQSGDTMTHPLYRYKGLFVELSNITFALCRSEGIRIVFGFPNQQSLHGAINKLGWKMTEKMDCFIIPVRTIPLERIAAKFFFLEGVYQKYKRSIVRKYRIPGYGIPNSVINDGFSGVNRDENYLAYKTYHKTEVLQVGQSLIWVTLNTEFIIGDMKVSSNDFDQVMAEIEKLSAKLGIKQIQFQISPGTGLHSLFSKKYKSVPSFPVLFQDFESGLEIDKFKFTFADIDIF